MAFSPSDAAFEGFRLTREKPIAVLLGWPLIYLVAGSLIAAALFAATGQEFVKTLQSASAMANSTRPDPDEILQMYVKMGGVFALMTPLVLIFSALNYAAVFRAVLRPEEKAVFFFRIGGDELRILLVSVVLAIVFVAAFVGAAVITGVAVGVGKGVGGTAAAWLVGLLVGVTCVALLIWLSVRLSLALPITFAEKRIALFDSWKLTKGRFWGLLGMMLLALIFAIVVGVLGGLIANAAAAVAGGGLAVLGSLQNPNWADLAPAVVPALAIYVALHLVLTSLQTAITYAPFASAYRALKEKA